MIPITVVPKGDLPSGLPGVAVSCAFCGSQPTKCVPCAQTAPPARGYANERRLQDDPRAGSTTNTALIDATETLIRLDR